jgi:LysM repeat protein
MNEPPNELRPAESGSAVCPFVAFDDDRRRHAAEPDRRHRCFAEAPPAPRSPAFQQTYCLGADFADCPTFQEWARRQAAREVRAELAEADAASEAPSDSTSRRPAAGGRRTYDWAAPPPWLADRRPEPDPDQLTAFDALDAPSRDPAPRPPAAAADTGDPELAALLRAPAPAPMLTDAAAADEGELPAFLVGRDRHAGARPGRPTAGRPTPARPLSQAHPAGITLRRAPRVEPEATPPWETPRRFESYPAIRSRRGLPSPSILLLSLLGIVAAIVLLLMLASWFSTPATHPGTSPTPSSSASEGLPTPTLEPSGVPGPTTQVYIVLPGDTMSSIANKFGLTLPDLVAANPQLTNPNTIAPGDQINIPAPATPQPLPGESPSSTP